MNKLSTLVLATTVAFSAPAFAQTLSDLRSNPFLAQTAKVEAPAAPVKMEAAKETTKKSMKKHSKKAKKAVKAVEAAPAAAVEEMKK
jgi:hypothetical protein